jgi:SNF2 family DNA or RNA helicase
MSLINEDDIIEEKHVRFSDEVEIIEYTEELVEELAEEPAEDWRVTKALDAFDDLVDDANLDAKSYQRDGVKWILERELLKGCGGFVADEMGLGKTIMLIGVIMANLLERTLIVVPCVLVEQWAAQIYRITGKRAFIYDVYTPYTSACGKIVIVTYSKLRYKGLHMIKWNRIIFDEGHHLRNRSTIRFRAGLHLKSPIKWIVSGTPIQNGINDFRNLCAITGSKDILRRTKKDVGLLLPKVHDEVVLVPWRSREEELICNEINSGLNFARSGSSSSSGNDENFSRNFGAALKDDSYGCVLPLYLRSRQSCILPKMIEKKAKSMVCQGLIDASYLVGLNSTSKMDAVVDKLVERSGNGCGKLVFCNFREEIDMFHARLTGAGLSVGIIDGRSDKTEVLKGMYDVLLLQILTCCEGINLQENYSEIYFVSAHWNPCVEDQAVARCHRIGQKKPVYVFRFQMVGTNLESYIGVVQENKRAIAKEVL